jgi:uncharacterized protein YecT (DUF1311 family)
MFYRNSDDSPPKYHKLIWCLWNADAKFVGQKFISIEELLMLNKYRYLSTIAVGVTFVLGIYPTSQVMASQAGKEYNLTDEKLSQTYQALVKKIQDPNQKRKLISAQTAWLNSRNADAKFFGAYYQNSKGGLFYKTKLTKDRIEYLQAIIDRPPTNDNDNSGSEKYTE